MKKGKGKRNAKYLFPKRALSVVYRALFMAYLRREVTIPQNVARKVMSKNWVVYAKQPFMGPKAVIEYLGRYTHKIAISNHRLLDIANHKVSFKYKDYAADANHKVMALKASEFIRRFALHVLPPGFRRMRHYGILAARNKAVDLNLAKKHFGLKPWVKQKISWQTIALQNLNINPKRCPVCKKNSLIIFEVMEPHRGPPVNSLKPNYDF
jgi:hypothetical protein